MFSRIDAGVVVDNAETSRKKNFLEKEWFCGCDVWRKMCFLSYVTKARLIWYVPFVSVSDPRFDVSVDSRDKRL